MPVATSTHTQSIAFAQELITIPTQLHIVKTITANRPSPFTVAVEAFVELGLMHGGINSENRIAILASGYIGNMNGVSWSGSIPTEPETFIYAYIWADAGISTRLSAILYKIMLTKEGMFLVDP